MQANPPVRAMYNLPNGQMTPIRTGYAGPRMQYQNQPYVQMQQNQDVMHQGGYVQTGYQVNPVNYNGQHFQYQQVYQTPQSTYRPMYVMNPPANQNYNVIPQQQMHANAPTIPQQRAVIYQPQQPQTQHHQQQPHHQQQQHQPAEQQQKKRPAIILKDPNTGKDVTSEILKKKDKPPVVSTRTSTPVVITQPTPRVPPVDAKLQANAIFASQVAALSQPTKSTETPTESKASEKMTTTKETELVKEKPTIGDASTTIENKTNKTEQTQVPVDQVREETKKEETKKTVNEPAKPAEPIQKEAPVEAKELEPVKPVQPPATPAVVEVKESVPIVEPPKDDTDGKEVEDKTQVEVPPKITEETVVEKSEDAVETTPEDFTEESTDVGNNNTLSNGHDDPNKSAISVAKKKNKKQRMKDLDAKQDTNNTDLLSAFTDTPQKEEVKKQEVEATPSAPVKPKEDATWEEKDIDKEVIKNDDTEDPEIVQQQQPRVTENRIIKTEAQPDITDDEKLQYDRDFLLKFQFAPICTSKPANLPNIDIVLDQAHQPTKPLVPGQRISNSNDFMPTFMRQASGGRQSGGSRSKDRRGPPSMGGSRPQKVINLPQFEKLELKRSENAWVRPAEKTKELSEDQRDKDELKRSVQSILNKLTPQKFKTLVDKMTALKINNVEKLELSIGLIFEKAISEPGFSVAYANMCRVLTEAFKAVPGAQGEKTQSNNFRKLLLNKCQKEFEKEKSDEKQMEEDRNKTFDTELEKKAWLEELDYKELGNRRRSLGNIRFIGELFKLKMISEKIMHECILKLLRSTKQESLEDQLECLCKLLSTIGKDLDHQEAKPRMDQYFQQIHRITEKKKISSRIKFALQDVIDLRICGWVPRRDEGNPKTIDQIHREAQQKEKENDMARQQDKLKRSEPRSRGGGRDSPVVRVGQNTSSDGWTSVSSKTNRSFAPTPVDASKFKIKKNDSSDISLGPGGRPGAWSRGASGGSSSRSGSGSNTPTNEIEQKTNRFDLLSDSSTTAAPADNKRGGRQSNPMRKGSNQGTPNTSRRGFATDDRSAALRAVKDMTGRNSRNQSPVRSGDTSRNSPASGTHTPVDSSSLSPNPTSVDDEKMRKVTKSTVEEFFGVGDYKEAMLCIQELNAPHLLNVFIEEVVVVATEKKHEHRVQVGKLVCKMMKDNVIKMSDIVSGFTSLIELAPDLAVDIPLFYKYLGEVLGPIVADGTFPLNTLKGILDPLIQFNKAGLVMAEALNTAVQYSTNEEAITALWIESGLTWDQLLEKGLNIDEFVKDKKVEYTLKKAAAPQSHASKIQEELLSLLKAKADQKKVMDFIDEKVPANELKSPDFVRELTNVVCTSTLAEDENKQCICEKELIKIRKNILLRYIDGNKALELQAAYALQQLVSNLNHPRGLLTSFFEELYDGDIISEETFFSWETSKEFPDGKGVALSDVKAFLTWLKKADEESNEEDSTSTGQTNLKS